MIPLNRVILARLASQLQVRALACEANSHHNKKGSDDASEHHPTQTRDPSDELEKDSQSQTEQGESFVH